MTSNPDRFASEWAAAWNARDLDRVLRHFREQVVFSTPKAVDVMGQPTVTGVGPLRAYWERALSRITTLHFTVVRTLWDPVRQELSIIYDREINGQRDRALELLALDAQGMVTRGEVFYGVIPVEPGQ